MGDLIHRSRLFLLFIACACSLVLVSLYLQSSNLRFRSGERSQLSDPSHHHHHTSAYRQRLNLIRPVDTVPHSKTLAVASRIYVINLPRRHDRYLDMTKLERALDLEFTWQNATDSHSEIVQKILERIRWWRNENRINQSDPKADPSPFKFKWAKDINEDTSPLDTSGSDLWTAPIERSHLPPLPPPPFPDTRPPIVAVFGENGDYFSEDHISLPQIACWHSHYRVLRNIADGDDEVAIVFEDDIDLEWDTEKQLRAMWNVLPPQWDIVMIGELFTCVQDRPVANRFHQGTVGPKNGRIHLCAAIRRSARPTTRYAHTPMQ